MKRFFNVFLCCLVAIMVVVTPLAQVKTDAIFLEAGTAATIGFYLGASVLIGYTVVAVTGQGNEFYDSMTELSRLCVDAGVYYVSDAYHTVVTMTSGTWNAIKAWWAEKWGTATVDGNTATFTLDTDIQGFHHFNTLAECQAAKENKTLDELKLLERSKISTEGWVYSQTFGDCTFTWDISYNTNTTGHNTLKIYNSDNELIKTIGIGPNYGSYGDWVIQRPCYVTETNTYYTTIYNKNTSYHMHSGGSWTIGDMQGATVPDQSTVQPTTVTGERVPTAGTGDGTSEDDLGSSGTVVLDLPITKPQLTQMSGTQLMMRLNDIVKSTPMSDIVTEIDNTDALDAIVTANPDTVIDGYVATVIDANDGVVTPAEAVQTAELNPPVADVPSSAQSVRLPQLLLSKFPFCLIYDLYNFAVVFNSQAEVLTLEAPLSLNGVEHSVSISLQDFDVLALIVRWGLYAIFCVGLIWATKSMMF